MIYDAKVEVTCDGENCLSHEMVQPEYVYRSMSGSGGHYDTTDSAIEKKLEHDYRWVVRDGKHYCCPECAGEVPDAD